MGGVKIQTVLGQGRGCSRKDGTGQSRLSPHPPPQPPRTPLIYTLPSIPPVARAPDGNPPQCSSSFHVLISSHAPRLHVAPTSLGLGCFTPTLPSSLLTRSPNLTLHLPVSTSISNNNWRCVCVVVGGCLKGEKRGQIKHCSNSVKQPAFYRDRNKQGNRGGRREK